MNKDKKIGIIGLGLIGGSILKALVTLNYKVYGVSRSSSTLEKAKVYTNKVSDSLEILKDCDVVFVCTPMNKTIEILEQLEDILPASTIVTDVCSLKGFLTTKKYKYDFIPSHPMAGTEFSGFDSSFETLFQGAKWVMTPYEEGKNESIKTLTTIINELGANEILTTPEKHDEAVALISHMPMIISQALFKSVQDNELALKLASSGFRDMTRLALSNEEMANDMVNYNSENIQKSILKLYASVGELLNKNPSYPEQINEIKNLRNKMYLDGKNIH